MFGVPINVPYPIYGDNMSVIANWYLTSVGLKKKKNYIAYHKVS